MSPAPDPPEPPARRRLPLGVTYDRKPGQESGSYRAILHTGGLRRVLGHFATAEEAGAAYLDAAATHGIDAAELADRARRAELARARWDAEESGAGGEPKRSRAEIRRRVARREAARDEPLTPEQSALAADPVVVEEARRIAARWGRRFPRLEDAFLSTAMMAVVRAARTWSDPGGNFRGYVVVSVDHAMRMCHRDSLPQGHRYTYRDEAPGVASLDAESRRSGITFLATLADAGALDGDDLTAGLIAVEEMEADGSLESYAPDEPSAPATPEPEGPPEPPPPWAIAGRKPRKAGVAYDPQASEWAVVVRPDGGLVRHSGHPTRAEAEAAFREYRRAYVEAREETRRAGPAGRKSLGPDGRPLPPGVNPARNGRYCAAFRFEGRMIDAGTHDTPEQAAEAGRARLEELRSAGARPQPMGLKGRVLRLRSGDGPDRPVPR